MKAIPVPVYWRWQAKPILGLNDRKAKVNMYQTTYSLDGSLLGLVN